VEFSTTIEFAASPTAVAEMFATEEYVRRKITASGATDGTLEIIGTADGAFTVTTRRTMPTDEIPANYRSLVGSSLEVRQVEAWDAPSSDGTRHGSLALEITGAPVRVTGTLNLAPAGEGRSTERVAGEIKASIPFFGKAIERAVADNVHRAVAVEQRAARAWLAQG